MSFEIHIRRNRTADFTIELKAADGTAVLLEETDVVRVKVGGTNGIDPTLDLSSIEATANGSVCEFTAETNLVNFRIAQGDTDELLPQVVDMEVAVVDDSETAPADAIKHVQTGLLYLHGSPAGDVGIT